MQKGRVITGVIGGVLGFLSLFSPFLRISGSLLGKEVVSGQFNLFKLVDIAGQLDRNAIGLYVVVGLIAIGSVLAFARPAGGIFQLLGWLFFGYGVMTRGVGIKIFSGLAEVSTEFAPGFYLAVLASVITLSGFALASENE